MSKIDVIRFETRSHQGLPLEEPDPSEDMLLIFHRNPEDPEDPDEFCHHIPLYGIAYRKEMWGLTEYADVIDQELKDLERYYLPDPDIHQGVHPLAPITEHYFNAPREQMAMFDPGYLLDAAPASARTEHEEGEFSRKVAGAGLVDVMTCLASTREKSFPCKGMTGLSTRTVRERTKAVDTLGAQTSRITLTPGKGLDGVRQYLTDKAAELEPSRSRFVTNALNSSQVPHLMLTRTQKAMERRAKLS